MLRPPKRPISVVSRMKPLPAQHWELLGAPASSGGSLFGASGGVGGLPRHPLIRYLRFFEQRIAFTGHFNGSWFLALVLLASGILQVALATKAKTLCSTCIFHMISVALDNCRLFCYNFTHTSWQGWTTFNAQVQLDWWMPLLQSTLGSMVIAFLS